MQLDRKLKKTPEIKNYKQKSYQRKIPVRELSKGTEKGRSNLSQTLKLNLWFFTSLSESLISSLLDPAKQLSSLHAETKNTKKPHLTWAEKIKLTPDCASI